MKRCAIRVKLVEIREERCCYPRKVKRKMKLWTMESEESDSQSRKQTESLISVATRLQSHRSPEGVHLHWQLSLRKNSRVFHVELACQGKEEEK
jgi:hypothetical protein